MLKEILGIFDLLTGLFLILLIFGHGGTLAIVFAFYLIIKGLIFIKDFTSLMDLGAALFIVLAFFGVESLFAWIFVVWLIEKGIVSLLQ